MHYKSFKHTLHLLAIEGSGRARNFIKCHAAFLVITPIMITVILWLPLISKAGWPQSHELRSAALRTQTYAEHFSTGDFFPVWAINDASGYGTPMPFYYHKTFYYFSGAILLLLDSMKLALGLSVAAVLFIGAVGMYRLALYISCLKSVSIVASLLFITSNYVFINWLLRGAVAELTAMMLMPFVIYWSLKILNDGRFSYGIVPLFLLLIYSHNVIALYALIIPVTAIIACVLTGKAKLGYIIRRSAISSVFLLLLIMPWILAGWVLGADYNPASITAEGFTPREQTVPASSYIVPRPIVWLSDWQSLVDTQIGVTILIPLGVVLVAFSILPVLKWKKVRTHRKASLTLLSTLTLIYFFLLTSHATFLYEKLAFLSVIQFPWRLLSIITPMVIVLGIILFKEVDTRFNREAQKKWRMGLLVLVFGSITCSSIYGYSPILKEQTQQYSSDESINLPANDWNIQNEALGIGEYLPVYFLDGREVMPLTKKRTYILGLPEKNTCDVNERSRTPNSISLEVVCLSSAEVVLPHNYSRLTTVRNEEKEVRVYRKREDPRVHVNFSPGAHTLEIQTPTYGRLLKYLIE